MAGLAFLKELAWAGCARSAYGLVWLLRRASGPRSADEWRGAQFSYSQLGEDRVVFNLLASLHGDREKGLYVDVGAFDPVGFSNTLLLHQHGWRGVNIDANPDTIERFRRSRPGDVNIRAAVSDRARAVLYVRYASGATNRIVDDSGAGTVSLTGEAAVSTERMTTRTLADILGGLPSPPTSIDFLNVDCEGEDLNVLRSLDWSRWQPLVIAIEAHVATERAAIREWLASRGYSLVARLLMTAVFARDPILTAIHAGTIE
jgi:FkbM family methyltransferase